MGRRDNADVRGYVVRIQTQEGRVFRNRKLRLVFGKSPALHRLDDRKSAVQTGTPHTGGHDAQTESLSVVTWRSHPARDKDSKHSGGRGMGRAPVIEETTLEEFVRLAQVRTEVPGEAGLRGVDVVDPEDEQTARLYRLGILYDGDAPPKPVGDTGAAADSAYQADSLDTIRHADPLYSVRHVVAKRRGKRASAGTSAAKTPLETAEVEAGASKDSVATGEPTGAGAALTEGEGSGGFVPGGFPLLAFDGVWEDSEGQTIEGRDLWNDLQDLEYEYVVLRNDDLASLAGSWVELESVLGTDDGEGAD